MGSTSTQHTVSVWTGGCGQGGVDRGGGGRGGECVERGGGGGGSKRTGTGVSEELTYTGWETAP